MEPNFYLHIVGIHKAEKPSMPPIKIQRGPFLSAEQAMDAAGSVLEDAEYKYSVWVDEKPDSK